MKTLSGYEDRVTEYYLDPKERPTRLYEYWVTGHGEFPFDMLRHDNCNPITGCDAAKLQCYPGDGYLKNRSVKLRSHQAPTIGRWSSFGWSVGEKAVVLDETT